MMIVELERLILQCSRYSETKNYRTLLFRDLLSIIKGFRNGLVYGFKIRFPHALVMTFLFRSDLS